MKKLGKLKMPEKRKSEMEMEEMDYGMESMDMDDPELAAQEEEMGMDLDGDMEEGEPAAHQKKVKGAGAAMSDDELLAEVRKRGLMKKLGEEEEGEEEEMDLGI